MASAYSVALVPAAQKELDELPEEPRTEAIAIMAELREDPRPPDALLLDFYTQRRYNPPSQPQRGVQGYARAGRMIPTQSQTFRSAFIGVFPRPLNSNPLKTRRNAIARKFI